MTNIIMYMTNTTADYRSITNITVCNRENIMVYNMANNTSEIYLSISTMKLRL